MCSFVNKKMLRVGEQFVPSLNMIAIAPPVTTTGTRAMASMTGSFITGATARTAAVARSVMPPGGENAAVLTHSAKSIKTARASHDPLTSESVTEA